MAIKEGRAEQEATRVHADPANEPILNHEGKHTCCSEALVSRQTSKKYGKSCTLIALIQYFISNSEDLQEPENQCAKTSIVRPRVCVCAAFPSFLQE